MSAGIDIMREGKDAAVIAVGNMVAEALQTEEILAGQGIELLVADARFIKPLDQAKQSQA